MDAEALKLAIESLDGDYDLVRELGRGATAIVYLLRDHGLQRDVALKVIRGGYGTDEEAVGRLQREAHLVAQLQHPNIVKLYGTQRLPDGSFSLLMEHVPGRNLKEILTQEGGLPVPRVLEILKDVASALAYAHRRRIVHRDVKPENIYIDEEVGAARLADFGVARPWDQDSRLTIPGASLGTPAYMSPEQIDGHEVDGRSDVYSLGLVGYEMILGRHPWEGENVFTTIFKQKNEFLPFDLPGLERYPSLSGVLGKALEKDPDARWESADVLLEELKAVVPARRKGDFILDGPPPERLRRDDSGDLFAPAEIPPLEPEEGDALQPPSIDWPEFPDQEVEDGLPSTLPLPDEVEDEGFPLEMEAGSSIVVHRKRRGPALWVVLAIVIIAGSAGAHRWLSAPARSEPQSGPLEEITPPSGMVPGPTATPEARPTSPAVSLVLVSPPGPELTVDAAATLVTRAADPDGTPVADTVVRFQVLEGGGTLESEVVRTDADGIAETTLRLPTRPGPVSVRGVIPGVPGGEVRFQLTVRAGPPQEVSTIVGNGQSGAPGETLSEFVGVRVRDGFGNLVPNAPVQFRILEGGGRVQPSDAFTDDVGRAFARWTLGDLEGVQTLSALLPDAGDTGVIFEAIAEAPAIEEPQAEQPATPPAPAPVRVQSRPFAIGGSHICALMQGSARCRGGTDRGQGGAGAVDDLRALAAGVSHGCGLQGDGSAWCWGANESGQLGDGSRQDRHTAVRVAAETPFSMMVAGLSHTCGLDGEGRAFCWGRNLNGELGDGSRGDRLRPGPVAGERSFGSLFSGWNHTCGLTEEGRAYCWGLNAVGQLGDGTRVDRLIPVPVNGLFFTLAAGAGHTCGISGRSVLCWGDNQFGQLGDGGDSDARATPAPVRGLPARPVSLSAGAVHTCALLEDGTAFCWGQNLHGQLGNGSTENAAVPVPVAGGFSFTALYAGGGVTCGFLEDGAEYCWGMNQDRQLGDGTRTNRATPVRVGGG